MMRNRLRLDVMCWFFFGKTAFFPFSFFPMFEQNRVVRRWTLCEPLWVGKKLAKSLGVLEGWPAAVLSQCGVSKPLFQFSLDVMWRKWLEKVFFPIFLEKIIGKKRAFFFRRFCRKKCFAQLYWTLCWKKNWKNRFSQKRPYITSSLRLFLHKMI